MAKRSSPLQWLVLSVGTYVVLRKGLEWLSHNSI